MAGKAVAQDGDASATASTATTYTGATGAWAAGPVSTTPYPFLKIAGTPVIHQASCTFTFTATDGSGVTGTSLVTLTAPSTTLQKGSTFVLRDGDTYPDTFGNKVSVAAAHNLKSD